MSENIKNVEFEEVEETVEETKEDFATKAKGFMKKNGKKIVAGVAIVGGIGLAYAIGKNSNMVTNQFVDDVTDTIGDAANEVVTDL